MKSKCCEEVEQRCIYGGWVAVNNGRDSLFATQGGFHICCS